MLLVLCGRGWMLELFLSLHDDLRVTSCFYLCFPAGELEHSRTFFAQGTAGFQWRKTLHL